MSRYKEVRIRKKDKEWIYIGVFKGRPMSHVNVNRSIIITLNSTEQAIETVPVTGRTKT